jgi:hypothetical protein
MYNPVVRRWRIAPNRGFVDDLVERFSFGPVLGTVLTLFRGAVIVYEANSVKAVRVVRGPDRR